MAGGSLLNVIPYISMQILLSSKTIIIHISYLVP